MRVACSLSVSVSILIALLPLSASSAVAGHTVVMVAAVQTSSTSALNPNKNLDEFIAATKDPIDLASQIRTYLRNSDPAKSRRLIAEIEQKLIAISRSRDIEAHNLKVSLLSPLIVPEYRRTTKEFVKNYYLNYADGRVREIILSDMVFYYMGQDGGAVPMPTTSELDQDVDWFITIRNADSGWLVRRSCASFISSLSSRVADKCDNQQQRRHAIIKGSDALTSMTRTGLLSFGEYAYYMANMGDPVEFSRVASEIRNNELSSREWSDLAYPLERMAKLERNQGRGQEDVLRDVDIVLSDEACPAPVRSKLAETKAAIQRKIAVAGEIRIPTGD